MLPTFCRSCLSLKSTLSPLSLEANGAFEGPLKSGAFFQVRILIHELKKVREAAGLTLAAVSKHTGSETSVTVP